MISLNFFADIVRFISLHNIGGRGGGGGGDLMFVLLCLTVKLFDMIKYLVNLCKAISVGEI